MLQSDFQKLSVTGLVTLYELDATALGAGIMRWHGHTGFEDWLKITTLAGAEEPVDAPATYNQDIVWQGETYSPVPIKSDGLEMRGDGRASMPTLSIANNISGIQGAVSALCLQFDDFAGAKLRVINTLAKYLDSVNFVNGNPQAANEYKEQLWYIEQKTSENNAAVTFELSNPIDFGGAAIPSREITSFCHWCVHGRYRGEECGYIGAAMFKEDGTPTNDPSLDKCGGRVSDCILRFGENNPLPFGGFPSSALLSN